MQGYEASNVDAGRVTFRESVAVLLVFDTPTETVLCIAEHDSGQPGRRIERDGGGRRLGSTDELGTLVTSSGVA